MKKQKLREFIREFVKETMDEYALLFEASRSNVKKGFKDIKKDKEEEEDKEATKDALNKMAGVDKEDEEKFKKAKDLGKKGTKPGSEEKSTDKYGRNITKYTAVSKKGKETPMIQYDDDSTNIKSDFEWNSLKGIQDYHYEDKPTDVYIYNNMIIVDYRKENQFYSFPPTLFNRPKKMEGGINIVESTHKADGTGNPEKSSFSEESELIQIPKNKWLLIRSKWENRDSSKTKDFQKIGRISTKGTGILKGKDKKALFKGGSDKEGYFDIGGTIKKAMAAKRGSQFSG